MKEMPAGPEPVRQLPGTHGLLETETITVSADAAEQAGDRPLRTLQPHRSWTPHPLPEVEDAFPSELIALVVEIVAAEGPVVTDRVYSLCAAGWGKREFSAAERAALLHDSVEDHADDLSPAGRPGAFATLTAWFGPQVADLVAAVTNPIYAPEFSEHDLYRERVAASLATHPWARVIKAADFTDYADPWIMPILA